MDDPVQPEMLYHYQPKCLRWIEDVFFRRRIWLSNPATFNDVWDCRPSFAPPDAYSARELHQLRKRYRVELSSLVGGRAARETISAPAFLESELPVFLSELAKNYTDAIMVDWRAYCLSLSNSSALMWAHYASQNLGFCLGFRTDNRLFGQAQQIVYTDHLPLIKMGEDNRAAAEKAFLTKSRQWEYEKECRVLLQRARRLPPFRGGVRSIDIYKVDDDGYAFFPTSSFVALTFGYSCPGNVRQHVANVARQVDWRGQFFEVRKSGGAYSLSIEPYQP